MILVFKFIVNLEETIVSMFISFNIEKSIEQHIDFVATPYTMIRIQTAESFKLKAFLAGKQLVLNCKIQT